MGFAGRLARTALHGLDALGLSVWKRRCVPFGVQWARDLQYFPEGRALRVALDVGANVGQTVAELRANFPACRVHSFEPVPDAFAVLGERYSADARVVAVNCALGEVPGTASMAASGVSEQSSLCRHAGDGSPSGEPWRTVEVAVDTVDRYCEQNGIERVSLLKIDTEGFEMPVLRGAARMLREDRIDFVLAECEFQPRVGSPHGDFAEISAHLAPFGFAVVSFYTGGVDDLGWVWGDVLFVRRRDSAPGRVARSSGARHRSS